MSPKPAIDNLKKFTGQSSQLNPKLQAVLGNLDVQLEEELARYRREKRVEARSPQPPFATSPRPGKQKNIELVVTPTAEPFNRDRLDEEKPRDPEQMEQEASATPQSNLSPFSPQTALPQRLEAKFSSKQESSLAPVGGHTEQPNEYLESSEQLLGSLDDPSINNSPTQSRRRRRRSLQSILSPLTVGATLLFVLAIGTLAHVFTGKFGDRRPVMTGENSGSSATETPLPEVPRSPNLADKEFVPLDLDTLGTLSDNRPTPTPTPTAPSDPPTPELDNSATIAATPSQNYPSLENINTAILPQSVQDNPQNANLTASNSTAPNSTAPNNSDSTDNSTQTSTAATAQKPPTTQPTEKPETATTQPTKPTETSSQTTVSAQSFPAFFYVLIDYNNDDSLFLSRQVVPDAYVREFPIGVKIQMGAFEDNASAQTMVKYLKEQGLAAQVYQP